MSSVKSEWGMCCPKCGSDETLDVTAMISVRLTPDGTDAYEGQEGGHEWEDGSRVSCANCGWAGTVIETRMVTLEEVYDQLNKTIEAFPGMAPRWFVNMRDRMLAHGQLPS